MSTRRLLLTALAAAAASAALSGGAPPPNPAGGNLVLVSSEVHSGSVATNGPGGVLELAGTMDSSVEAFNMAGARASIGLLDPNPAVSTGAAGWSRYE